MEPAAAEKWALIALDLLHPEAVSNPISNWAPDESKPFTKNGVYVLPVNGPLMKNENCDSPGTSNMLASMQQAMADPNVEAIVLQIDSPGGTVDGTKVFADAIKASSKPVVAYVDGMMASAAMWIGSSASMIIASTATDIVGSIGTMMQWADFTEAYKQKGIKVHTATATQSTDKNRLIADATATGNYTELAKQLLDPVNEQFTAAIKTNRAGKLSENENVLTGKTYMAKDAIKHGLVDKIGTLDMAIKTAKNLAATKNKMNMEKNSVFQNTLLAAKAESFQVIDNVGFGLTEDQMTSVEARITELQTANATLTSDAAAHATALQAVNTELATATGKVSVLNDKIVELGARPAVVGKESVTIEDKQDNTDAQYLTSADKEKAKMNAKYGNK